MSDIISLFLGLLEFVYTVLYEPAGWLISVIPFGSDFVAWKDGFISGYVSTYILPIIFDVVMTFTVSVVAGPELGGGFTVISNLIGIIHFFDHMWEGIAFLFWGFVKLPVFLVLLAGSVVVPPLVTLGMVLAAIELVSRISRLPSANVLDHQKKDK